MPTVESRISTGYSKRRWRSVPTSPISKMIANADPAIASNFMKRAKLSSTKLPPKLSSRPCGSTVMTMATSTSSPMLAQFTSIASRSPRKTPNMSKAMAPIESTISGRTGSNAGTVWTSFMPRVRSMRDECGGLGGRDRMLIAVEQCRNRRRRHVEHGGREEAENEREDHERREDQHLARIEILERRKVGLLQRTENHFAIEPERIRRR